MRSLIEVYNIWQSNYNVSVALIKGKEELPCPVMVNINITYNPDVIYLGFGRMRRIKIPVKVRFYVQTFCKGKVYS